MKHPYDAAYLQEISETQGALFERLQDEFPTIDGIDFIRTYLKSETRAFLDKGDVYLATLGAKDLMRYYQTEDPHEMKSGTALRGFAPNWMGQFYSQYQWQTGLPSREVVEKVPPEWLACVYPGLHDLDLPLAVEKVVPPPPPQLSAILRAKADGARPGDSSQKNFAKPLSETARACVQPSVRQKRKQINT